MEAKLSEGKVKSGEAFYMSNNEPMCSLTMYRQLEAFFLKNELVITSLPTTLVFILASIVERCTLLRIKPPCHATLGSNLYLLEIYDHVLRHEVEEGPEAVGV